MLTEKTFDTGTVKLNYAEGPPSGPPIVLLHGISANWRMFSLFLPFLLPRWQVYALDSRGHGKSGHSGAYIAGEHATDTIAFLDGVVGQPVVIVGMSQGGVVGIRVAARFPQGVRALVVGDSPLYRETLTEWWKTATAPEARAKKGKVKELIQARSSVEVITRELAEQLPQMSTAWLRYVARSYTLLDPEIFAFLEQEDPETFLNEVDSSAFLSKITCPVLLLQSALMTPEDGQRALKQLPKGYLVHFDNMGHLLHLENQGYQVIATVTHFLESLL